MAVVPRRPGVLARFARVDREIDAADLDHFHCAASDRRNLEATPDVQLSYSVESYAEIATIPTGNDT